MRAKIGTTNGPVGHATEPGMGVYANGRDAVQAGRRMVALLEARAHALRAELLQLGHAVEQARQDLSASRAAQLREANEQLVLAALQAQTVAEKAFSDLGELTRTAHRDALTNTPDRVLMHHRLEHAIAMAQRNGKRVGVVFVDLDHFKEINDTLGHAAGDEVLRRVARCLESVVRGSDTVSRHGGDEFLVLLEEVTQAADAVAVVGKMQAALNQLGAQDSALEGLSASLGVALYPDDGADPATLINRADAEMYRVKQQGRGDTGFSGLGELSD